MKHKKIAFQNVGTPNYGAMFSQAVLPLLNPAHWQSQWVQPTDNGSGHW